MSTLEELANNKKYRNDRDLASEILSNRKLFENTTLDRNLIRSTYNLSKDRITSVISQIDLLEKIKNKNE